MKPFIPLSFRLRYALRLTLFFLSLAPLLLSTSSVVFAQWGPDRRLTYNDSTSQTSNNNAWCVAASSDSVHVVWYDYRDGNQEIYYKRSLDGGLTWASDVRLTNDSYLSIQPSVAVSGPNVHVVWEDNRNMNNAEIYYKQSTDGGSTWGSDIRLTYNSSSSQWPSVAVLDRNVHVVWYDFRDGSYEIYYKRSTDNGMTWTPDTRLTYDLYDSYLPSVAVSGTHVHVVWNNILDSNGNYEIYYKRSTDGGTSWEADTRLTYDPTLSVSPSIAASGPLVHVVWVDLRDQNDEIYYKKSTDSGVTWGPDVRLTYDSAFSYFPSIAVSGSNVHVVWSDSRDGNGGIYYKLSTDGGTTWGPDTRITNDSSTSTQPSVTVSGVKVHVVWTDYRDGNSEIYYKRNPTSNSGVEVSPSNELRIKGYRVFPNPFTSFTTLPGHESERFVLYDVAGRKVLVCKGDRIGEGLPAGVYFLRASGDGTKPLRIVKLR